MVKTLRPPQEQAICNSIDALQAAAYGQIYDSRSKPALAIKKFLAERQLKFKSKSDVLVEKIVLTDEQKEYVLNHSEGPNAEKPVEMAKLLFNNDKITPIHPETIAINEYLTSIRGSKETIQDNTDKETKKYLPPRRIEQAAARVNTSVFKDTLKDKCWESNITIKKCLESLIKFCHYPRFILLCNKYFEMEERNLFEGTYIAILPAFYLIPPQSVRSILQKKVLPYFIINPQLLGFDGYSFSFLPEFLGKTPYLIVF